MLCENILWASGTFIWANGHKEHLNVDLATKLNEPTNMRRCWWVIEDERVNLPAPKFVPDEGSPQLYCEKYLEPLGAKGKVAIKIRV